MPRARQSNLIIHLSAPAQTIYKYPGITAADSDSVWVCVELCLMHATQLKFHTFLLSHIKNDSLEGHDDHEQVKPAMNLPSWIDDTDKDNTPRWIDYKKLPSAHE